MILKYKIHYKFYCVVYSIIIYLLYTDTRLGPFGLTVNCIGILCLHGSDLSVFLHINTGQYISCIQRGREITKLSMLQNILLYLKNV
jgi:hypothetical protein